jgi:hypothetical protein
MMYTEYHKGQLCIHRFILCQEGFCSECAIHQQYQRREIPVEEEIDSRKLVKARRKEHLVVS